MQIDRKKVLVLALSGIGNFIMQSPVFAALKKHRPNLHLTVWVAPRNTSILAKHAPPIDEVLEAPIKNSLTGHLETLRMIRQRKFDIGIVLSPGQRIKSAAYLFLASIAIRIGNRYLLGQNPRSRFLLTHALEKKDELHDIEQNLRLLEPLGIAERVTGYVLEVTSENLEKAKIHLEKLGIPQEKPLIGFHPGSAPGFEWKRWPIENFAAVGQTLIKQRNAHILLFGGSQEENLKERLKDKLGSNATIIATDLTTTAAVMKHCNLFLSNDSGLMHLAAAVGTKTYGLFGPTDEHHTGPRGTQSYVIRAPGTQPAYHTEKNPSLGNIPHQTMLAITPEYVLKVIGL